MEISGLNEIFAHLDSQRYYKQLKKVLKEVEDKPDVRERVWHPPMKRGFPYRPLMLESGIREAGTYKERAHVIADAVGFYLLGSGREEQRPPGFN